jgi:hypothetical protein
VNPIKPNRADFRLIKKIIETSHSGKVEYRSSEFERVSSVFTKAGGSWESVFRGSPEQIAFLKKLIKVAIQKGFLTKKEGL